MPGPLEIEVKFHVKDINLIQKKILAIGAVSAGRHREYNIRFDDPGENLLRRSCLLRLRHADKTTLTLKTPPGTGISPKISPKISKDFKIQEELEVCVDDFDSMAAILESLGFSKVQVYEKIRETFKLGDTILCLDEMPFGLFLEIEGACDAIIKTAGQLGFLWEDRILDNYLSMFETIRRMLGLEFFDLTFENFSDVYIDFTKYTHLFLAGQS